MKKLARVNVQSLQPLEQFIGPEDNPKYFFTMTEIKKIGINPRTQYNTPAAVCSYPLTQDYYEKLIHKDGKELPFASDKPYICLFTTSDKVNVMTSYSESDLEKDVKTLKRWFPEVLTKNFINSAFTSASTPTPIGKFWNLTRLIGLDIFQRTGETGSQIDSKQVIRTSGKDWAHLLRNLGYTNFYDPGTGLMHINEPYQLVVFDTTIIVPIDTYLNPFGKVIFKEVEDPNRPGKTIMQPVERIEEADKDIFLKKQKSIEFDKILDDIPRHQLKNIWMNLKNSFKLSDGFKKYFLEQLARKNNTPLDMLTEIFNYCKENFDIDDFQFQQILTILLNHNNSSDELKLKICLFFLERKRRIAATIHSFNEIPLTANDLENLFKKKFEENFSLENIALTAIAFHTNSPPSLLNKLISMYPTYNDKYNYLLTEKVIVQLPPKKILEIMADSSISIDFKLEIFENFQDIFEKKFLGNDYYDNELFNSLTKFIKSLIQEERIIPAQIVSVADQIFFDRFIEMKLSQEYLTYPNVISDFILRYVHFSKVLSRSLFSYQILFKMSNLDSDAEDYLNDLLSSFRAEELNIIKYNIPHNVSKENLKRIVNFKFPDESIASDLKEAAIEALREEHPIEQVAEMREQVTGSYMIRVNKLIKVANYLVRKYYIN